MDHSTPAEAKALDKLLPHWRSMAGASLKRRDYQPWTSRQIERARKLVAIGVPMYAIDRYFGRPRNSTWQKLASLDNPDYRRRQIAAKRDWRATNTKEEMKDQR